MLHELTFLTILVSLVEIERFLNLVWTMRILNMRTMRTLTRVK